MSGRNERWWLTTDSRDMVIATTPESVFDLVADLPRMGEWSPECERVEWTGDSSGPAQGATFVGHNRGGPFHRVRWSRHGRVLAAERGREFAFVTEEGGRDSTVWRYQFEPVDGGTRVTESYEVRWIPTWARILDPLVNRHREIQDAMLHTLQQLKSAAEASTRSGERP